MKDPGMDLTTISTIIVALITAVIGPVVVEWVRSKIKSKKEESQTTVGEAVELGYVIDEKLEHMMDHLKCDRIWIAQFHNGGHFYPTGKSIQKFSIFYEKLSVGTASLRSMLQNIPVSLFPKALNEIHTNEELRIPSFEPGNEFYGMESISIPLKTKSFYMYGLYNLEDRLIGVMGIAFNGEEHRLSGDEMDYIATKNGVIGTLLTNYLYTPTKK